MSIFGAIGSIAGGLLGKRATEKTNRQSVALTRELAKYGIRYKVADAKAAGLHPLFALGSSSSISPTLAASGDALAGGLAAAGRELGSIGSKRRAAATHNANLEQIQSQIEKNRAEAKLFEAESQNIARQGPRIPSEIDLTNFRRTSDAIKRRVELRRGIAWDSKPLLVKATTPGGGHVLIPDQNVVETGEAVGAALTGLYGDITGQPSNVPVKTKGKGGYIGPKDKPFIKWGPQRDTLRPVKVKAKKRNPYKRGTAKYYRWKNQQRRR